MKYFAALLLLAVSLGHAQDNTQAPKKTASHAAARQFGFYCRNPEIGRAARGFQAKDVDKVAAMYSDDAVLINAEGTFHGTNEIKGELKKMIDRGDTVVAVMTTKAVHSGEIGFAEGTSAVRSRQQGAEGPLMVPGWCQSRTRMANGCWWHTPAYLPRRQCRRMRRRRNRKRHQTAPQEGEHWCPVRQLMETSSHRTPALG